MSVPLTPSKRQYDRSVNGKGKRKKSAGHTQFSPNSVVFRLLCPALKTGSIIGKGGIIISQIRQETGVNIKVEDNVPGCDERIVIISGVEKDSEVIAGKNKDNKTDKTEEADATEKTDSTEDAGDTIEKEGADATEEYIITEEAKSSEVPETTEEVSGTKEGEDEKKLDEKEHERNNQNEEDERSNNTEEGSKSVNENSAAQKALLLIFERIVEAEPETDETSKSSAFVLRLLVLSNQVGGLLGKAGSVIKQLSAMSGAQIRVLPRNKFPLCASASDELVQITGEVDSVRKALQAVSLQLMGISPSSNDFPATAQGTSSYSLGHLHSVPEVHPSHKSLASRGGSFASGHLDVTDFHPSFRSVMPKFHETGLHNRMKIPQEIFTFRVLCPEEKVGSVIGKGGTVVKSIKQDTGCEIKVVEGLFDSENHIIVISGPVHPDDRISAVQDAVLRVLTRIAKAVPDSENTITVKLLVSSNQIGCLLGMGGGIMAELRKLSGAYIRILRKDQIPKHAVGEEVVQINGDHEAVAEAFLQITARLQHHFFREAFPSANHPLNPPFLGEAPPFHSFIDRREFSLPQNFGPSFCGGPHRHGGFHSHDEHPLFMHEFRRQGISSLMSERKSWGPQGLMEDGGPLGLPELQRRIPGFVGSKPAVITSTTVEVVVPSSLVSAIYGEDGFCLNQIRQISDAKIMITDPQPGGRETLIIISGTPEQTNAAQSLIQAFVMSETEST